MMAQHGSERRQGGWFFVESRDEPLSPSQGLLENLQAQWMALHAILGAEGETTPLALYLLHFWQQVQRLAPELVGKVRPLLSLLDHLCPDWKQAASPQELTAWLDKAQADPSGWERYRHAVEDLILALVEAPHAQDNADHLE